MRRPEKPPPLPLNMPVLEAVQPQRPDRRRLFIELVQLHPQLSEPRGLQRQCTGTGRPGPPGIRKQLSASNESVSEDQSPHASSSSPPPAELGWVLTHHWNWAFGQELMRDGGWSRPHLPTISARALVLLLEGLGEHNVLLSLPGNTLTEASKGLTQHLVANQVLDASLQDYVEQLIASREGAEPTANRPVNPEVALNALQRTQVAMAGDSSVPTQRAKLDLSPDGEEEAFELLVANVTVITTPIMAFARLQSSIQTGCEKGTPVRFLFVLLAPPGPQGKGGQALQMATAFASIMLDEDFVAAMQTCCTVATFCDLLSRELDCVTIVPSSHIPSTHRLSGSKANAPASDAQRASGRKGQAASHSTGAAKATKGKRPKASEKSRALIRSSTFGHLHAGRGMQMKLAARRSQARRAKGVTPSMLGRGSPGGPPIAQRQVPEGTTLSLASGSPTPSRTRFAMPPDVPPALGAATGLDSGADVRAQRVSTAKLGIPLVERRASFVEARSVVDNNGRRMSIVETPFGNAASIAAAAAAAAHEEETKSVQMRLKRLGRRFVHDCQAFSLPLLSGIVCALVWANAAPESYVRVIHDWEPFPGWLPLGHHLTIKFVINDCFMVFFFGLAAKEVTEACLPGGSLNPPRKAISPLIGTLAGVAGPISVYLLVLCIQYSAGAFDGYESLEASRARAYLDGLASGSGSTSSSSSSSSSIGSGSGSASGSSAGVDSSDAARYGAYNFSAPEAALSLSELALGWGVPTATDISLAWMVAVQVFPLRHPAIEFLLLLAVADDAIGLIIIAVAYPDDQHPFDGIYLLLVLAGMLAALTLRVFFRCRYWSLYLLLGGLSAWVGLIKAALHPALALAFIVPFMPAATSPGPSPASRMLARLLDRTSKTSTRDGLAPPDMDADAEAAVGADGGVQATSVEMAVLDHIHEHDITAPLHAFEHHIKLVIDFGMFFFTLANAGVSVNEIGPLTLTIFAALIVGKMVFVTAIVLFASRMRIAPLHSSLRVPDVTMISAMASIGLTVALFIAGEAFKQERLQAEAKMGALLSGLMGAVCVCWSRTPLWKGGRKHAVVSGQEEEEDFGDDPEYEDVDDVAYIVASALERTYAQSRSAVLARERKAILAGVRGPGAVPEAEHVSARVPATHVARRWSVRAPGGRNSAALG